MLLELWDSLNGPRSTMLELSASNIQTYCAQRRWSFLAEG